MTGDVGKPSEFDLIASLFAPLTGGDERALGLLDDAAVLPQQAGRDTVITTDTMVGGIHFLETETPDLIARRLLRVNLSDLASMGAEPSGYFLNLTLPQETDEAWLRGFASGLQSDQDRFGIRLLGGDTTHAERDLTLTATLIGEVPTGRAITRGGAAAGDDVYVSGTIGDASLGLRRLISGEGGDGEIVRRFQLPDPRISFGIALRGIATAMADVSDGLAADLEHICRASNVSATISGNCVPLSSDVKTSLVAGEVTLADIVSGGDDYELVFTASPGADESVAQAARAADVAVTKIGTVTNDPGLVRVIDAEGRDIRLETPGYRHF